MQQRVTEHFRQQKPHIGRSNSHKKGKQLPELLGAHGEAAVTDSDIDAEERILRSFDLDTQFGPCTGLSRLERWQRAAKFGLNPPQHVYELLTGPEGQSKNSDIWHGRV